MNNIQTTYYFLTDTGLLAIILISLYSDDTTCRFDSLVSSNEVSISSADSFRVPAVEFLRPSAEGFSSLYSDESVFRAEAPTVEFLPQSAEDPQTELPRRGAEAPLADHIHT